VNKLFMATIGGFAAQNQSETVDLAMLTRRSIPNGNYFQIFNNIGVEGSCAAQAFTDT